MRHQLLPILADALEHAGFALGVDWHVRVRELLACLPEVATEEQFRDALCAITATDPEGQERFHELYSEAVTEWNRRQSEYDFKPPAPKESAPGPFHEPEPNPTGIRWAMVLPLAALAVALTGALLWWWTHKPTNQPDTVSTAVEVASGGTSVIAPDSTVLRGMGKLTETSFDEKRTTTLGTYMLQDSARVLAETRDSIGNDTLRIQLKSSSGRSRLWQLIVQVVPRPPDRPGKKDTLPEITHALRYLDDHRTERDTLLLALRAPQGSAFQAWLARYQWPLKAGVLLLLAGALYALLRWRERQRPLTAARERADQPPFSWNIRLGDARTPEWSDAFYIVANRLRRRESADTRRLDVSRTVRATIESGGLPEFRYRELTRPPEYLLLIDQQDANDHRAALFNDLAEAFKKQEVLLDRFFFSGELRLCWNEEHPAGLGIRELVFRYPNARLIVLGDGYRLLGRGKLAAWTQVLDAWKQRALLSPVPPTEWSLPERRLAERFAVLPALLDSLEFLASQEDQLETGVFRLTEPGGPALAREPAINLGGPLITTLKQHFSRTQMQWIAACAIWPSLHYELTVWLGQWLAAPPAPRPKVRDRPPPKGRGDVEGKRRGGDGEFASSLPVGEGARMKWPFFTRLSRLIRRTRYSSFIIHHSSLKNKSLSAESLRQLTRLEWFVRGRIPDDERLVLLEWLERDSPGLLRQLQAAMYRLLAAQEAPHPRSAVSPGYQLQLALLGWMSTEDPAERARLEDKIKEIIRPNPGPDVTALKALNRRRTLLDVLIPPQLRRQVHPGGFPALGWTPFWRDAARAIGLFLLTLGMALLWQPRPPDTCPPEQQVRYRDQTLCLQTTAQRALYRERLACDTLLAARAQNPPVDTLLPVAWVDSLMNQTRFELPPLDTALVAAEHWSATAWYNIGVRLAHRADTLAVTNPGPVFTSARLAACLVFERAAQKDPTLEALAETESWCKDSGRTIQKPDRYADNQTRRPAEDMALVPGGIFTMGCKDGRDQNCQDDEKPAHEVQLDSFYLDRNEVTNAQYAAFLNEYGSDSVRAGAYRGQPMIYAYRWGVQKDAKGQWQPAKGYEQHPVVYVTWYGANEYARFYGLRLPTEAEWEYAARGGAQSKGYQYSGSNNLDEVAWYGENLNSETHPVRGKKANELGLYDMSGNVWEWCSDWYDGKYYEQFRSRRAVNPTGPTQGANAVLRGGSWFGGDYVCRSAVRFRDGRVVRDINFGFRCARAA